MSDFKILRTLFIFNPKDLCKKYSISFEAKDSSFIISSENWPPNLIHNEELVDSPEMFFVSFCSDTSLVFFIDSAIDRCKSLISRAIFNPDFMWEHGNIYVYEIEGVCSASLMVKTRTNLAVRKLND